MDTRKPFKLSYFKSKMSEDSFSEQLKTVPDYLHYQFRDKPNKVAFVFVSPDGSRETVSFKDWYERAMHVAKCFVKLGVKRSECVAVSMRNCPEWLYTVYGVAMAGARPISLSFTYADGSDVIAIMKKLQTCSAMVLDTGADEENWNIFKTLVEYYDIDGNVKSNKMPFLRYLICHDEPNGENVLSMKQLLAWEIPDFALPKIYQDDIFILLQTSGSTGAPKLVAHTHASYIIIAKNFSKGIHMNKDDHILYNDRPLPWIGGIPLTWIYGYTRVVQSGYCEPPTDAVGFLINIVKQERCTNMLILSKSLHRLMDRQDELGDDWPLEFLLPGGQPITKSFSRCIGKLCKTLICAYGRTEYTPSSMLAVDCPQNFPEYTIGYSFEGVEMKIVDEKEETVPVGKSGEIYVRTEGLFKEYYNDPELTMAARAGDGWSKTDDIGFMREDGLFYFEGRKSDMIISGGMNVSPCILEAAIQTCPGVSQAVCVPIPHPVLYQVVCACVILNDGSDITEAGLRVHCEKVHNDKREIFTILPKYYLFMEQFPELSTGKISRKKLTKIAYDLLPTDKPHTENSEIQWTM